MKKIVRGNDFMLRVPVRKIVNGEKERFPLPACEEIEVNLVNAFRRRKMEYTIGVEDDSLLEVRVQSSEMALGAYALEVKGKLFGCSWRSNEYEQLQLVDNNASGDTEFDETDEGEASVEMDTALVVLAPVIVTDVEVLKDEIANGVRDGAWLPVKAGRDANGNVVKGAVAEGIGTTASGQYSHAEGHDSVASGDDAHAEGRSTTASGNFSHTEGAMTTASGLYSHAEGRQTEASGIYSHAEGRVTKASGESSHTEGSSTKAIGVCSHAEGVSSKAIGHYSHAEGDDTIASGNYSHAQGTYNYDDKSFVDMVGIGNYEIRKNASVIYIGRDEKGYYVPTDPKNGYQYLLNVGGYKGQEIGNAKSVQEVFADHDSRISAVENGGSVKKSKPKIEYVVGRAIKCSLLTCSSYDRVRYIVPENLKTISLLVGTPDRSLLAKNGDSIKVKFVDAYGHDVSYSNSGATNRCSFLGYDYTVSIGSNNVITITNITQNNEALHRVSLDILFSYSHQAWYVRNVTLGDDSVYLVTLAFKDVPSSFDTVSPYRKFENGIVVNKRLPKELVFDENTGYLLENGLKQKIIIYKHTYCRTKWRKDFGGRGKVKKIRKKKLCAGIGNIVVKHDNEKKSCYMQTLVVNSINKKIKRLH